MHFLVKRTRFVPGYCQASVGIFSVAEGMKHDFASKYVIAQAIVAPPNTPLSFSLLQAFQFLDRMQARASVRIFGEDGDESLECPQELGVSLREFSEFAFKG